MSGLRPHQRHAIRFLLTHLAVGTVGGLVFGVLLLLADAGGLATLIFNSVDRVLYLILLFFGLFITFGSVGMAWGIMSLGQERD